MNKRIAMTLAVVLIALSTVSVLAHGGHRAQRTPVYTCTVENCALTGLHTHSGRTYAAHTIGDGHDYHPYCSLEDCTLAGYHAHDGVYCFGHVAGDGHDYHAYCPLEDCTLPGYHAHDGTYCFGHTAGDGHGHGRGRGHH